MAAVKEIKGCSDKIDTMENNEAVYKSILGIDDGGGIPYHSGCHDNKLIPVLQFILRIAAKEGIKNFSTIWFFGLK